MKRAVTSLIGIMVLCGMLVPADAQNKGLPLPNRPMLEGALIIRPIDDAYRQFWESSAPIEIRSKNLTMRDVIQGNQMIFQGAVKVNQDDTTLACDKLVMLVTANRTYFTASGNVMMIQGRRASYRGETHGVFRREMR